MKNRINGLVGIAVAAAMIISVSGICVTAAGFSWPTLYDMETESYPFDNMANVCKESGHENTGYFADPTDPENNVLGTKKCDVTGKYADVRAVMNYTPEAVQFDFDIYRTAKKADFEIKLFANTGSASGTNVSLFKMNTSGEILLNGKTSAKYDTGKWYSVRIKSNKAKMYHEIYLKKKAESDYMYIGSVSNADLGFKSDVYIHYFIKNSSVEFDYLDNMSWVQLENDLSKKIRYDFNNVEPKTGRLYDLAINSNNMNWSSAEFDGQTTLKATMNETTDTEVFNWEDIPDMEKVYVETNIGFDSGDNEKANLPYQFGIRPVFETETGEKGVNARNNMTYGIRFECSRSVSLEENVQDDKSGAIISNNKLYRAGYMFDRENKIFKAYFIGANGKTFVADASQNQYVQAQRHLAGIKLYQRAKGDYKTGSGYYDYLYIDEADALRVQNSSPMNNEKDVSPNSDITLTYNNIIDPDNYVTAVLKDSNGNEIPTEVETSFGNKLVIKPIENLKSSKSYTLSVSGVKDLIGQKAEEYTCGFMTGSAINIEEITLNSDNKLIDGNNRLECRLVSNDGNSYTVSVIATVFDKDTNELLAAKSARGTIDESSGGNISLDIDTGEYSNYYMEIYIWSGLGTMKPYSKIQVFNR